MPKFNYECPKCKRTMGCYSGKIEAEKQFCIHCGTEMILESEGEVQNLTSKEAETPIVTPEITPVTKTPVVKSEAEKEVKAFESDFEFHSPISISESKSAKTIINGVLLSEGLSTNGNLYTIESLEKLDNLTDIPIFLGTTIGNKHNKTLQVGKIIRTFFDRVGRKVKFTAEIFNQKVAETVSKGWGISVGGLADGAYVLDSNGKLLNKIKNLVLNHVQLLAPQTRLGMANSRVESVEIQESMTFSNMPRLSTNQIRQIVASLIANGEIPV